MMMDTKFLNKLKEFGLNTYEAKIWTALLSRGVSSAGELSDISNVPRSRAYDVLESLEKKGFIVMKLGKPIKYIAVKPEEVLERVKQKVHQDSVRHVDMLDSLKKDPVLNELETLYNQGIDVINPTDLTAALKDRQNYYNNLNTMINNAEKKVVIMTTAKGMKRKAESLKRSLERARKRGVSIIIAGPVTKESKEAAAYFEKIGTVKAIDEVKARFCIVDDNEVSFSLLDDEEVSPTYDVGVWVKTPFFASALMSVFNQILEE
jgi:HTH-type transcriptional regulator, sugar sensing transcriptional regulator